jgi:hypothetical protein
MARFPLRRHPHLYQINAYAWLEQLSAKYGRTIRLAEVPGSEWDYIAGMGFDIVWLMGVWQRSPISRRLDQQKNPLPDYSQALPGWTLADIIGSPYSVLQYEPDPRIGTWNDIDVARETLHRRKMALYLDFVGNHTALDHPWTRQHPEYYIEGTKEDFENFPHSYFRIDSDKGVIYLALGKDPYFPAWSDVAQLNHFSPEMRVAQLAELKKIASHCDGVRCDMAMLQLNEVFDRIWRPVLGDTKIPAKEFWTEARSSVPDLVLLAEAYWGTEGKLIDLGVDFVYDKGLYDSVRDGNTADIHWRLAQGIEYQSHLGRILENHDEPRFATVFANDRLPAVATFMGTLPGLRFYQQGEELGIKLRTPIELRTVAEQPIDVVRKQFFSTLFAATNDDVFHSGHWSVLPVSPDYDGTSDKLFVYEWRSDEAWRLVAVNLSDAPAQGIVRLQGVGKRDIALIDVLDGTKYLRKGGDLAQQGLFIRRDAYQAHLFDVQVIQPSEVASTRFFEQ